MPDIRYQEWIEPVRIELHRLFRQVIKKLAEWHFNRDQYGEAIIYLARGFYMEPEDEELARLYIMALFRLEKAYEARRIYELHSRAFENKFGIGTPLKIENLAQHKTGV